MKNVLDLKVGGAWMALSPDTSISIEMTSPLWNDSGTFSYTFQVPYFANRHIFNASNRPESDVNLKTFRKRFELYTYGLGFLFGDMVCTSDEIDIENDRIDVELRSANATFEDAIDGKSLQDLDLDFEKLVIGTKQRINREYFPSTVQGPDGMWHFAKNFKEAGFREEFRMTHNGTKVYPSASYINIPIIVVGNKDDDKEPLILSAYRAFSSPCFFVSYILQQVLKEHNYAIQEDEWDEVEDLRRLIFINTKFAYKEEESGQVETLGKTRVNLGNSLGGGATPYDWEYKEFTTNYMLSPSADNLPDVSISEFVKSLSNAFGLKIIVNESKNVKIKFLRNIFRSTELKNLHFKDVISINKQFISFNGIQIKYNEKEGEGFVYKSYTNMKVYGSYNNLLEDWMALKDDKTEDEYTGLLPIEKDTTLRIDKETGNFYRTKVDKETFDKPSLFEVAQFLSYDIEGYTKEDKPEEQVIGFTPVIPTSIAESNMKSITERELPTEAFFADVEVTYNKNSNKSIELPEASDGKQSLFKGETYENLKELLEFDCGFTLGIVRTSPEGSLSENYSIVTQNVDGFGNDEWVRTLCTTTVTSDSVSRDGALFDYNGTDEGIGTPMEQLVSLKLWSGKQNFDPASLVGVDEEGNTITGEDVYNNNPTGPLPNRGLVPQFLSEYLHFMKHRKPISVVGYMHVSELVNIEWDKYHEVAGYRGLLDKIKFTLSMEGISPVTVEHFVI